MGFYQTGAPIRHPTLVSKFANLDYEPRQCTNMFPEAFQHLLPRYPRADVDKTNKKYHGWFVQENHLFFANGQRTPDIPSTYSIFT